MSPTRHRSASNRALPIRSDLIGPRHLFGGVEFYVLNLIDVGSHLAANTIIAKARPVVVASALTDLWATTGVPTVAQFDNHSNFWGAIPPAYQHFGPVVATCLDLGVTPRFIPIREPWRNGVIEHFNDVWDQIILRTETFTSLKHLQAENQSFIEFHNQHHRYSAHLSERRTELYPSSRRGRAGSFGLSASRTLGTRHHLSGPTNSPGSS